MAEQKWIISANYRDRGPDRKRWLVRRIGRAAEDAVAVDSVVAHGVTFEPSSVYEEGFGCSIVAHAEDVRFSQVNLRLVGHHFYDEFGDRHDRVAELRLNKSGGIQAVPA